MAIFIPNFKKSYLRQFWELGGRIWCKMTGLGYIFQKKKNLDFSDFDIFPIANRWVLKKCVKVRPKSHFLKKAISGFTRIVSPHSKIFLDLFFLPKKFGFDVLSKVTVAYSTIEAQVSSLEFFPPRVSWKITIFCLYLHREYKKSLYK